VKVRRITPAEASPLDQMIALGDLVAIGDKYFRGDHVLNELATLLLA
jgi:hypothetical protein